LTWKSAAWAIGLGSLATLVYGCLVEANRLTLERKTLPLKGWPKRCAGFKLAVLGDLHIHDTYSRDLALLAVAMALEQQPDFVALVGDMVSFKKPGVERLLAEALEPLLLMNGSVAAIFGNHEYDYGNPSALIPILKACNIKVLRNESWKCQGVTWVGIDSANAQMADPEKAMKGVQEPAVVLWHEPDVVDLLPKGANLMVSGHSHGGQFRFWGGLTPMHTHNGRRYPRGFYPHAPTPLYVTRGVGTTGPPSRLNCPPEVSLLTLVPGD